LDREIKQECCQKDGHGHAKPEPKRRRAEACEFFLLGEVLKQPFHDKSFRRPAGMIAAKV